MNAILELLRSFWRLFVWWTVILPWEEGIRVRGGKHRRRLAPGVRFRIPYLDSVYKQSNRLRWSTLTPQTVTTLDGLPLTLAGQLGYRIVNIDKLYDTLHQAEGAVRSIAQGAIAEYVHTHHHGDCTPMRVASGASQMLDLSQYGLAVERVQLTTFCRVKSYRLIMDREESIYEDLLNTMRDDSPNGRPA